MMLQVYYYNIEKETFNNISNWINFIKDIENPTMVIIGNKIDLIDQR